MWGQVSPLCVQVLVVILSMALITIRYWEKLFTCLYNKVNQTDPTGRTIVNDILNNQPPTAATSEDRHLGIVTVKQLDEIESVSENTDKKEEQSRKINDYLVQLQTMVSSAEELTNNFLIETGAKYPKMNDDSENESASHSQQLDASDKEDNQSDCNGDSSVEENLSPNYHDNIPWTRQLFLPLILYLHKHSSRTLFCCDTGAVNSFITKKSLTLLDKRYKNKIKIFNNKSVHKGIGGISFKTFGKVNIVCKMEHHEDTFTMTFIIIKGAQQGNLLGMDFLTRFQASVQCRMTWELQIREPRFRKHIIMMSEDEVPYEYLYTDDDDESDDTHENDTLNESGITNEDIKLA